MKASVISFTENGMETSQLVIRILKNLKCDVEVTVKNRRILEHPDQIPEGCRVLTETLQEWTGRAFACSSVVIFIGAVGIAVRAIAPFVKDKRFDPAVIVMDEKANFVIPLLSGHIGGANRLAEILSAGLLRYGRQAICAVTTATDINGRFAVDVFAVKNGLWISNMKLAKEVSAGLLSHETIQISADSYGMPILKQALIDGTLPQGLKVVGEDQEDFGMLRIHIGIYRLSYPCANVLYLVPKAVVLGIGCRRGVLQQQIESHVRQCLEEVGIFPEAVCAAASVDLKKDERGLAEFAREWEIPLKFYSADTLLKVPGEFSSSAFVASVTGVDNVCERSAVKASLNGRLIMNKMGKNGVTVACAVRNWRFEF